MSEIESMLRDKKGWSPLTIYGLLLPEYRGNKCPVPEPGIFFFFFLIEWWDVEAGRDYENCLVQHVHFTYVET